MSNLKKVLALSLVLALALTVASGAAMAINGYSYTSYSDANDIEIVNGNYRLAADLLKDIGVVIGKVTPDTIGSGSTYMYDPKGDFDRATLSRVLYLLHTGFVEGSISNNGAAFAGIAVPFKDIGDSWAANYIKYCYAKGLLSGRNSTTFDPTAMVTAQELATVMLALRGYTKADLAKNYPTNVVTYGYTGDCNLFDAGVAADSSPDPVNVGVYLPGTKNAGGVRNFNAFKEFGLTEELTREQAFYMIFNNLTNGVVVMKLGATITTGTDTSNIVFDTYLGIDDNYLDYQYDIDFYDYVDIGIVTGSSNLGMGSTKSGAATKFKVDGSEYIDYGYTATVKMSGGNAPTGYTLSVTNWDANVGRKIVTKAAAWEGTGLYSGEKAWGYAFIWDGGNNDPGITGTDVIKTKAQAVVADGAKIKIDGTSYELYMNMFVSTNNAVVTSTLALADAIAALKMGTNKSVDQLTFKLIDGKVYGVFAINTTWQKVTEVGTDGKIKTDVNTTATATNIAGLAKDDYILAYVDAVDGLIKGTKATKSAATAITVGSGDAAGKFFIGTQSTGTQIVTGDSNGINYTMPTIDPAKTYYLYSVGAYVYRVEEFVPAANVTKDILVTGEQKYESAGKFMYVITGYVNGNPATVETYTTAWLNTAAYDDVDKGEMWTGTKTATGTFVSMVETTGYFVGTNNLKNYVGTKAVATIGSGIDGVVTITSKTVGAANNGISVVVTTGGDSTHSLDASYNAGTTTLTITLARLWAFGWTSNLSANSAENIANIINTLTTAPFTATYSGDGTGRITSSTSATLTGGTNVGSAAEVDVDGEFFYEASIVHLTIRNGGVTRSVSINPTTTVYVLKAAYGASTKTLGDTSVQKVFVKTVSNDVNTTAVNVIAITNE